jgi:hypothetical protein
MSDETAKPDGGPEPSQEPEPEQDDREIQVVTVNGE